MEENDALATTKRSRGFVASVVLVSILVGGVAYWGTNKQVLGLFHDDGIYAVVAKSVYQGDGYRIISLPSIPPQTKYPFLYSYLLSWVWVLNPIFPQNIALLKTLNTAILLAIFIVGVVYYRRHFSDSNIGAILFALIVCTNPIVFTYTDYVVSDLFYVLLALGALTVCQKSGSTSNSMCLTVISGLACLTRLAAVPLVIAGSVEAFLSTHWRGVAYFIGGVLVFVAPWLLWVSLWPHYAPDSLFGYYSAYDLSGAKVGDLGTSGGRRWAVVLGNTQYLVDAFDFLYLLPLMPGLGFLIAVLTAIGIIDSVRGERAFAWVFFYPRWPCCFSGLFIPSATWHRWCLSWSCSCSAAWRSLSIGFNLCGPNSR